MIESVRISLCVSVIYLLLSCFPASAADVNLQAKDAPESLSEKLRAASLTISTSKEEATTSQDLIAAARADYTRLTAVLYDAGFYGGIINILVDGKEASDVPLLGTIPDIKKIDLRVDPGPAFVFKQARVAPVAPGTELPEGFVTGATAKSGLIKQAVRAGISRWRDVGHAKVELVDQSITADHRGPNLSADIRLNPGPQLRFGDLTVSKDGGVRASRIRKIAALPNGQVFSPAALNTSAERLRRTGSFQSVVLHEAETSTVSNTLDIDAELTAAKPRRIGFGGELSSLEGVTLSTFWLHRNLFGGAERLRLDAEVGGIGGQSGGLDYSIGARYERPATLTADTDLFLEFRLQQSDEPDFRERSVQIGGGFSHRFSKYLTGEAGLAYRFSDVNDDLGSRTLQNLLLPARLIWDSRDNALDAKRGYFLTGEATPFLGLNRSATGARIYGDLRGYKALGQSDRSIVLAGRTQIGSVLGASVEDIPPEFLFFSGGAGTVRGQPFQSLSVDLGNGLDVGGRSFLGFSGEVRVPVSQSLSTVAFVDTGFIGEDGLSTNNGEWQGGAGFGVRYATGVGPIRFDVGTPLDGDAGSSFEVYIGIGQAF